LKKRLNAFFPLFFYDRIKLFKNLFPKLRSWAIKMKLPYGSPSRVYTGMISAGRISVREAVEIETRRLRHFHPTRLTAKARVEAEKTLALLDIAEKPKK